MSPLHQPRRAGNRYPRGHASADLIERMAIREYDGGLSRQEAETAAIREYLEGTVSLPIGGLLGELHEASRVRHDARVEPLLQEMGLLSTKAPLWGLSWVVPEGGTYRPVTDSEMGHSAVIVPAFEEGELVDLVAEGIASRRVLPRTGLAVTIGSDAIQRAKDFDEPLLVFDTPSAWLRGHGLGVVIVDWSSIGFELDGVRRIACRTSIAGKVHNATRRCWPRPTIATPTAMEALRAAA